MNDLPNEFPFETNESIDRLDVLETLMTVVGELVLTRNPLIRVLQREADSAFARPLQRLVLDVDRFIGLPRKQAA